MVTRGLVLLLVVFGACTAHRFFFHNQCAHLHVWVGILGSSILEHGGFHLRPGRSHTTGVPTHWSGRIWGRTHCRNGLCQTGDCGGKIQCAGDGGYPPATLAEITLDAGNGSTHDFYHISLTDGYNLQMSMVPVGGVHAGRENTTDCTRAGCDHDLNQSCPPELQVRGIGGVIGCQSPCLAYDRDEYCCRGDYDTPKTCPPYDYSITFKKACTDAYSYALDEESSSFTCQGSRVGSSNYNITFCG